MSGLLRDLRVGARTLAKTPVFSAVAVATLALGIGAATAVFAVVHAVLLRPMPYPEPDRLAMLWEEDAGGITNVGFQTVSDWRERARSFEGIGAVSLWTPTLVADDGAEMLHGESVSSDFFRVMGVHPLLGAGLTPDQDRPQHNRAVVLSHGLWQRRFGSDTGIVGRTIRLGDTPYLVMGVMPPGFESSLSHPEPQTPQIWRPLGYDASLPQACRDCRHLRAVARLAPGVSVASAQAELAAVQGQVVAANPSLYSGAGVRVNPFEKDLVGPSRPAMQLLLVMVALLLSIAWANLASLFLARGAQRRRELAVQLALGASRWAILRQRLAESLLVAVAGGAFGVLLGRAGAEVLLTMAPAELPRLSAASPAAVVSLAAAGLSLLTALVLGVTEGGRAWRTSALSALETARGASGTPARLRLMGTLILTDVAVSVVLMVGAGLLGTSLFRLLSVDAGFERRGLLTLQVSLSGQRYREDAAAIAFYDSMLDRLRALPGVTSAAVVSQLPLGGNFDAWGIHAEDKRKANPAEDPSADRYAISPEYLTTMRIPVRWGRGFSAADRKDAPPVVLVGETLAARVWPGEDVIGKRIRIGGTEGPWRTVVGVVGDVRHTGLDAPRTAQVYVPIAQSADGGVDVVVRTTTPPAGLAHAARAAIASVDPTQAVSRVATMEEVAAESTGKRRFISFLAAVFAGLALLLAAVGVAGVVSRSVTDRTREIGIRLALGALPSAVRRMVLSRLARLTLAGAVVGLAGAFALAPLMRHVLFGIAPHDMRTLVWTCLFVIAVPMLAGWLPARRASRLDPVQALHEE